MSRKYKFYNPDGVYPVKSRSELFYRFYFVSFAEQGWVDGCLPQVGIHQNSVEEGFVFRAEDYVYGNAADYAGGKGLLEIIIIK